LVVWPQFVVSFYQGPGNSSIPIDNVNRGVRNAFKLLPVVSRVADSVGVDYAMSGVGQNRKVNFSFAVGGNLLSKTFAFGGTVNANCIKANLIFLFYK
jgi:hypothetical protein